MYKEEVASKFPMKGVENSVVNFPRKKSSRNRKCGPTVWKWILD
jgi:hypothetical protein